MLLPNSGEDLTAFFNRIAILPFLNTISETKKDKELLNKLLKEKDAVLRWAIKGARRYIQNKYTFSPCKTSQDILVKYKMQYNLHKEFIDKCLLFNAGSYCFTKDLKDSFAVFCKDSNIKHSHNDEKSLISTLKQDIRITYKRINRGNENLWGFKGVEIKPKKI